MPHDKPRPPKAARVTIGTFAPVIRLFLESPKFAGLASATQAVYRHLLTIAERPDILGAVPLRGDPDEILRPSLVQAFLDGYADRPYQQANALTAIKSLERWARVRDLLPQAITTGTEAPGGKGGHVPWTAEQVALAERENLPHISRAVTLTANTGQRGSDIVRMRWSDIEEHDGRLGINVTQKKTKLVIWIPLTRELQAAMATWERRPTFIILKADGMPFTRPQFTDAWRRARKGLAALISLKEAGLVMHGLRATAVVRLSRAGATTRQIADMVGMSEKMVARYCRFSVQRENALAAVRHIDGTAVERSNIVPFGMRG